MPDVLRLCIFTLRHILWKINCLKDEAHNPWFTFTRGVYWCFRTCSALMIYKHVLLPYICLKDQAHNPWFSFTRGVYWWLRTCCTMYMQPNNVLKTKYKIVDSLLQEVSKSWIIFITICKFKSWYFSQYLDAIVL